MEFLAHADIQYNIIFILVHTMNGMGRNDKIQENEDTKTN
jgi:hypothetical protein